MKGGTTPAAEIEPRGGLFWLGMRLLQSVARAPSTTRNIYNGAHPPRWKKITPAFQHRFPTPSPTVFTPSPTVFTSSPTVFTSNPTVFTPKSTRRLNHAPQQHLTPTRLDRPQRFRRSGSPRRRREQISRKSGSKLLLHGGQQGRHRPTSPLLGRALSLRLLRTGNRHQSLLPQWTQLRRIPDSGARP